MIGTTVGGLRAKRARVQSHVVALVDAENSFERIAAVLDRRRRRLANSLLARSPSPGDRVAILLPDGSDGAEVLYAITTAGITQLNVSDRLTRAGTAYILEDSGAPRVIVTRRSARGPIAVFAAVREVQGPRLLCQVDHLPRNAIAKVGKAALSQQLGRLRSPARRRADMAAEFRQEEDANAVEAR